SLRVLREARSFTQKELAEACGIERNTISKYENGWIQPSRDRLRRMLTALGVDYAALEEAERFVTRLAGEAPAEPPPSGTAAAPRDRQIRQVSEDLGRSLGRLLELLAGRGEGGAEADDEEG
ncbi:MAG TPA: helix-turn-helix transcriptional regulator, partial [Thermoanaerobaculia bacterium]|nr:helix-turn-helix transcriptional regulator [Thermoanaerobaculia bacterium]